MDRTCSPAGSRSAGSPRRGGPLVRGAAAVAAFCLALAFVPVLAGAAPRCAVPGRIDEGASWESIRLPRFSSGQQTIVDYTVHDGKLIVVTNGAVVVRSTDGGCRWSQTFDANSSAASVAQQPPRFLAFSKPTAGGPILLLAEEKVGGAPRAAVFRSTNGGASFERAGAGLPPIGRPVALRVAPDAPSVAYLGVSGGNDQVVIDQLYATTDGGTTWTLRGDLSELTKQQRITGFEIDPLVENELWAYGPSGGFHSVDGGRTFAAIDDMAGQATGPVDVYREAPKEPARLAYFRAAAGDLLVSMDGGAQWLSIGAPDDSDSLAHGGSAFSIVSTARGHAYLFLESANAWVDLQARAGAKDAIFSGSGDASYWVRTGMTIERYVRPELPPPPDREGGRDGVIVPSIDDLPEYEDKPARFSGPSKTIVLRPGDERTMTYSLTLPAGQRPLDLFFLVDSTGSMKHVIDQLKVSLADVINGLAQEGIEAKVGLGEYRAYPDHVPPRPNEPNFVYRRRVDLTHDMETMRAGLQALTDDGGGQYDAQLGALEQVATGKGVDLDPQDPDDGADQENTIGNDVPPGQQPSFRYAAQQDGEPLRLVLNISNEPFGRPNPNRSGTGVSDPGLVSGPPIPSFGEVASALRARGIRQIGLSLGNAPGTHRDLAKMAEMTDTIAPGGGVDCDGDGITDVEAGASLVCGLGGDPEAVANIAAPIVNLVKALPVEESPSLEVAEGEEVVASVTPGSYDGVALRSGQTLPFRVTYTCSRQQAGESFPVRLRAVGDDGVLGELGSRVRCANLREPADRRQISRPPLLISSLLLPVVPPLAPPGPPVPISEISSATSSQAQTQAQAQAQAAAAAQRQHQPQLAFAHQQRARLELAKEEEYEMSAYNRRDPEMPPSLALVAAAAAMSFAFGMAMRSKSTASARARRRPF